MPLPPLELSHTRIPDDPTMFLRHAVERAELMLRQAHERGDQEEGELLTLQLAALQAELDQMKQGMDCHVRPGA